jgi:hypothetical protein
MTHDRHAYTPFVLRQASAPLLVCAVMAAGVSCVDVDRPIKGQRKRLFDRSNECFLTYEFASEEYGECTRDSDCEANCLGCVRKPIWPVMALCLPYREPSCPVFFARYADIACTCIDRKCAWTRPLYDHCRPSAKPSTAPDDGCPEGSFCQSVGPLQGYCVPLCNTFDPWRDVLDEVCRLGDPTLSDYYCNLSTGFCEWEEAGNDRAVHSLHSW